MNRVLVVDANVLISDVVRFARTGRPTALSRMIGANGAVADVCVPPSVIEEVREHLPEVARRKVRPEEASAMFDSRYAPFLFVEESAPTGTEVETALALRDADDVAVLALALSLNAVLLSKDRDLVDSGGAVGDWLDVVLAIQLTGSVEGLVGVGVQLFVELPTFVQIVMAAATLYLTVSSGPRAARLKESVAAVSYQLATRYAASSALALSSRINSRLAAPSV